MLLAPLSWACLPACPVPKSVAACDVAWLCSSGLPAGHQLELSEMANVCSSTLEDVWPSRVG